MIIRLDEDFFDFAEYKENNDKSEHISFKTPYVSTLINMANQTSQATRPSSLGFSLNEYMNKFTQTVKYENQTVDSWKCFVKKENPNCENAIVAATQKIMGMLSNYKKLLAGNVNNINSEVITLKNGITVFGQINEKIVADWIMDLLYLKTFNGFQLQNTIIKSVADKLGFKFKFGTKEDESKGIDGYIGDQPVNVKPDSYKAKVLTEKVNAKMIYYTKLRDGSYDIEFDINPRIIFINHKQIVLKYFKGDVLTGQDAMKIYNDGYNAIEGNFVLSGQNISVLKNRIPLYITGDYNISKTGIQSIEEYSPISVLGNFDVSGNQLVNLKGIGEYIGKNFIISNNPIKTLTYSPDIVGRDFIAEHMSIRGSEQTIDTLIRGKLIISE